ncbi:MAG: hypothetical protein GXO26_06260, partial [Crenarchaeota archaeon]|nr:hypothetical protein [Thermoproteota archaeon]
DGPVNITVYDITSGYTIVSSKQISFYSPNYVVYGYQEPLYFFGYSGHKYLVKIDLTVGANNALYLSVSGIYAYLSSNVKVSQIIYSNETFVLPYAYVNLEADSNNICNITPLGIVFADLANNGTGIAVPWISFTTPSTITSSICLFNQTIVTPLGSNVGIRTLCASYPLVKGNISVTSAFLNSAINGTITGDSSLALNGFMIEVIASPNSNPYTGPMATITLSSIPLRNYDIVVVIPLYISMSYYGEEVLFSNNVTGGSIGIVYPGGTLTTPAVINGPFQGEVYVVATFPAGTTSATISISTVGFYGTITVNEVFAEWSIQSIVPTAPVALVTSGEIYMGGVGNITFLSPNLIPSMQFYYAGKGELYNIPSPYSSTYIYAYTEAPITGLGNLAEYTTKYFLPIDDGYYKFIITLYNVKPTCSAFRVLPPP